MEIRRTPADQASCGDSVGLTITGLDKGNMPRTGDVIEGWHSSQLTGPDEEQRIGRPLFRNRAISGHFPSAICCNRRWHRLPSPPC